MEKELNLPISKSHGLTKTPARITKNELDIFEFSSPIEFIDSFLKLKSKTRDQNIKTRNAWSLGSWAKRLKLSSSATLTNILKGRKLPSPELCERMALSMSLRPLEAEYFHTLVEMYRQKTSGDVVKIGLQRKLRALASLAKTATVDPKNFEFVCKPHHHILREMTSMNDFREDAEWIRKRLRFPLTQDEISSAIQDLLLAGLLERSPEGHLRPSSPFHDTQQDLSQDAVKKYFIEAFELSKNSVYGVGVRERNLSSNTFLIEKSRIPEIKNFIQNFRQEFLGCFSTEPGKGDAVYQINIALIPTTQEPNERGDA